DRSHQLVVRYRVEVQIGAKRVQLERLIVDDGRVRLQLHGVFARRLGIHRDQEIDFFFPGYVAVLAGANGEPGRQALNIRGEHVLSRDGDTHLEDGAHQNIVRRL